MSGLQSKGLWSSELIIVNDRGGKVVINIYIVIMFIMIIIIVTVRMVLNMLTRETDIVRIKSTRQNCVVVFLRSYAFCINEYTQGFYFPLINQDYTYLLPSAEKVVCRLRDMYIHYNEHF